MVEMYLYPEVEFLWAQAEQGYSPEQQPLQANMEAVAAAQKLLSDAHVTDKNALQHQVRMPLASCKLDHQSCIGAWFLCQSSL